MSPPGVLVSIDPGKKKAAWAAFVGSKLAVCGMEKGKDPISTADAVWKAIFDLHLGPIDEAVCEIPQHVWAGSVSDVVAVSLMAGAILAQLPARTRTFVEPRRWKGGRPKHIDHRLTDKTLDESERAILDACGVAKSLRHNVKDAVGVGLNALKRR